MKKSIIKVEGLKKYYGPAIDDGIDDAADDELTTKALDGITLDIKKGDYVAVMGPSGSGKSTLMQILGLLDRKTGGEYILDGVDTSSLDDNELAELRSSKIGFIFQFFNLLPRTTSIDNVALPMIYSGNIPNPKEKATELLKKVGLGDRLYHKSNQLSGGQQQRVAIARSLANDPEIIFADEPTGNISSNHQDEVLSLLDDLNSEGVTIILVTHEREVADRARRIVTVKDGVLFKDERLREIDTSRFKRKIKFDQKVKKKFLPRLMENLRMAFVALNLNKIRTFLATLGIMIGISSVVTMMGVGSGAKEAIGEQLSSLGTNLLYIKAINPTPIVGSRVRKFSVDNYESLRLFVNSSPSFKNVDAQIFGSSITASYGSQSHVTNITGARPSNESMQNNYPIAGRFFNDKEDISKKRVALIGTTLLEKLFPDGINPLGSTIKVNRVEFQVIGVLPSKGATAFRDRDDTIVLPLRTAMSRLLGKRTFVKSLIVELNEGVDPEVGQQQLKSFLRELRKLRPGDEDNFKVKNLDEIRKIYDSTTTIISSMLAAIASVSLLVGGIGIMNIMLVAVKERTREIGLRKAIGAKGGDIKTQFLIEAMMIGLGGGALGVFGGYCLSYLSENILGWRAIISIQVVFAASFFSIFIGVFFGLWPASQASKLSPIEALRYE